jgi:hypothetical protein
MQRGATRSDAHKSEWRLPSQEVATLLTIDADAINRYNMHLGDWDAHA